MAPVQTDDDETVVAVFVEDLQDRFVEVTVSAVTLANELRVGLLPLLHRRG
jgi:hypothetical protein